MKNNPNWSNYHKEQQEMKDVSGSKKGFKGFIDKLKKKKIKSKMIIVCIKKL